MANECIPLFRPGVDLTAQATADVIGKRFVSITGPTNPLDGTLIRVAPTAAAAKAFGVAVRDAKSGEQLPVIAGPGHIVPVTRAATIVAGNEVEVAAGGRVIAKAAGIAVGLAVSTTTAADTDVFVKLY